MYYEGARDRDSEWINYPDDYDVASILVESGEIDSDRLGAIENGSPLEEAELQILRRDHADNEPEGWNGVLLWEVELKNGPLSRIEARARDKLGSLWTSLATSDPERRLSLG